MDTLLQALILGGVSGFSNFIGGLFSFLLPISKRRLGLIMAFGAGALIASMSFGLMEEGFRQGGLDATALGMLAGAGTYYLFHRLFLHHAGPKGLHFRNPSAQSGLNILLASILDGLPEQFAIGVGLAAGTNLGFLVMLSAFLAGVPEGISGTETLAPFWGRGKVSLYWVGLGVLCTLVTVAGFLVAELIPGDFLGFLLAFAGGSVLAMLADTMLPEAFRQGGSIISVVTVAGFMLSFVFSRLQM
ncbi:MAG: hypothetical protein H0Z38_03100 [Firmicutes bacterium]|nr:hypothetical protein [Bacillota bacterium]